MGVGVGVGVAVAGAVAGGAARPPPRYGIFLFHVAGDGALGLWTGAGG